MQLDPVGLVSSADVQSLQSLGEITVGPRLSVGAVGVWQRRDGFLFILLVIVGLLTVVQFKYIEKRVHY